MIILFAAQICLVVVWYTKSVGFSSKILSKCLSRFCIAPMRHILGYQSLEHQIIFESRHQIFNLGLFDFFLDNLRLRLNRISLLSRQTRLILPALMKSWISKRNSLLPKFAVTDACGLFIPTEGKSGISFKSRNALPDKSSAYSDFR